MGLCSLAQIRAQLLRNRLETCTTAVPSSSGGWVQLFLMHPLPSAALSNHNRVTLTEEACKVTICELVRFALNEGFPNYSLRSFRSMRVKRSSEHMAWPPVLPEQLFWSGLYLGDQQKILGGEKNSVAKNRMFEKHSCHIRLGISLLERGLSEINLVDPEI